MKYLAKFYFQGCVNEGYYTLEEITKLIEKEISNPYFLYVKIMHS